MLDLNTLLNKRKYSLKEMEKRNAKKIYLEFIKIYDNLYRTRNINPETITNLARKITLKELRQGIEAKNLLFVLIDKYLRLPNFSDPSVPQGYDKKGDIILYTKDIFRRNLVKKFKKYDELGNRLGIFSRATNIKVAGDGFPFLFGFGALLERAIINLMLDTHIKNGYQEISVPTVVNERSMFCTGAFPFHVDNAYHIENTSLYLNPTIEIQQTNLIRGVNFKNRLKTPFRIVGFARSFRVENEKVITTYTTLHEFGKVELFIATRAEDWKNEYDKTIRDVEEILEALELPYRRVLLCTGSMGISSHLINDYEVFAPGSNEWWEVTSVTSHSDFPSRRMNTTYTDDFGKLRYVFTLHVPALSVPRILSAILENHQLKNGDILIPKALRKYMNNLIRISRNMYFQKYSVFK